MLAAFANLGFVLGKMPSSNVINDYRQSDLVEQYRQEQIVDLDALRSEGGISEADYTKQKSDIEKQSKASIADIVYANDSTYQGALKTNEALSYCSIAANCIVIAAASTYLGLTIKRYKDSKKEAEASRKELQDLLEKYLQEELSDMENN